MARHARCTPWLRRGDRRGAPVRRCPARNLRARLASPQRRTTQAAGPGGSERSGAGSGTGVQPRPVPASRRLDRQPRAAGCAQRSVRRDPLRPMRRSGRRSTLAPAPDELRRVGGLSRRRRRRTGSSRRTGRGRSPARPRSHAKATHPADAPPLPALRCAARRPRIRGGCDTDRERQPHRRLRA